MDSDEVRKRKEYAERKVKERHAALRKEAEERRKHTVEHRERVQSQLKREQLLLQKHMQQLNEDEERKAATLARQHEATSRIAAISKSPNKSFAFGSSTPRTLAYLDNLPKSEQQYDKKLRPLEGASPAPSPVSTSPNTHKPSYRLSSTPQRAPPAAHRPAPAMTSMTSSMYVTSSAPTIRQTKHKVPAITNRVATSTTRNSMMTQSVYTSRPTTTTTTASTPTSRLSSGARKTPVRPITATPTSSGAGRRSMDVRKPPMPRKSLPPEVKKAPIVEESPREVPEVTVAPEVVVAAPEVPSVAEVQEVQEVAPEVTESVKDVVPPAQETPIEPEVAQKIEEELVQVTEVAAEPLVAAQETEERSPTPEAVENVQESLEDPEVAQAHQHEQEEKVIVPEVVEAAPKTPDAPEATEAQEVIQETSEVVESVDEVLIPSAPEETHEQQIADLVEIASNVEEEPASPQHHDDSLNHEDTSSSLAEELMEIHQSPEVKELHYPLPDEKSSATNDLVDVFGNDFINGARQPLPPAIQQHVEFDEDTDSGKASPTSSETSSTTDEVTPRGEEVKAVRVMPIVRSAEDIAKKEREAIEQEERKARLQAILAKSRGMASPVTNTLPPTSATISGHVDSPSAVAAATTTSTSNSPPTSPVAAAPGAGASGAVEESAEKANGGAGDVLARLAAKTNLPSLQKILQRKQGSNPSLQTTEPTGGEIY